MMAESTSKLEVAAAKYRLALRERDEAKVESAKAHQAFVDARIKADEAEARVRDAHHKLAEAAMEAV